MIYSAEYKTRNSTVSIAFTFKYKLLSFNTVFKLVRYYWVLTHKMEEHLGHHHQPAAAESEAAAVENEAGFLHTVYHSLHCDL